MTDTQTPALDDDAATPGPTRYVEWVHFGDPGWKTGGAVTVAWALHFDGVRIERKRAEAVHGLASEPADDPWWMRAREYRDRITSWSASGGAVDGTVVTFWVDADAVEIDESDTTRLRVKVHGRDILTPVGYPVPTPPQDKRYPVQVHMYVNRFTVGPMLNEADGGA